MVDKSSHYEYLATFVDDILIQRKDLIAVINSLKIPICQRIWTFQNPEYYLDGNSDILIEGWKDQGLVLALSAKDFHQKLYPEIQRSFLL
jgi:hypothetical protein